MMKSLALSTGVWRGINRKANVREGKNLPLKWTLSKGICSHSCPDDDLLPASRRRGAQLAAEHTVKTYAAPKNLQYKIESPRCADTMGTQGRGN